MSATNKNVTSDFLRVLLALKDNIFNDLNVADVCTVESINEDSVLCRTLSDQLLVSAITLKDLEIQTGDIVLVIFCNTDFRMKLQKIKAAQNYTSTSEEVLHSKSYGVIVGIVYRTGEEET